MRGYHARPLENVSAFLQSASKICGGTLLPPLWGSYIQGDILVPEIVDSLRKPQIITAQGIAGAVICGLRRNLIGGTAIFRSVLNDMFATCVFIGLFAANFRFSSSDNFLYRSHCADF